MGQLDPHIAVPVGGRPIMGITNAGCASAQSASASLSVSGDTLDAALAYGVDEASRGPRPAEDSESEGIGPGPGP